MLAAWEGGARSLVPLLFELSLAPAVYCSWVLSKDDGTADMRRVSDPIREGAEGFLMVQYGVIGRLAVFVAVGIFFSYKLRDMSHGAGIEALGSNVIGIVGSVSFVVVRVLLLRALVCLAVCDCGC